MPVVTRSFFRSQSPAIKVFYIGVLKSRDNKNKTLLSVRTLFRSVYRRPNFILVFILSSSRRRRQWKVDDIKRGWHSRGAAG